ncbi:twin-arginine translocase subunit TatC [candidate division KSB1 bacterium]|nr:twin-arginine translocase subunit TatC [candidate division KSB1 bacterium]
MTETNSDQKKNKKRDEKVMPFLDHLDELRTRLLRSILSIFAFTIVCYFFSPEIVSFLTKPYPDKLIFLAPTESFVIHIKISVFAGIILSLPVIFYQLWKFVAPGLLEKERKYVPLIILFSCLFFLTGAAFCYYVIIPFGLKFLLGYQTSNLEPSITIKEYLSFVTLLVMVFGIVFELPLLSYFLTKIGILNPGFMRKHRRYGIVLIFIAAAILTPPDVVTQLLLAGPLLILYEISILVSAFVIKSRSQNEDTSSPNEDHSEDSNESEQKR